MFNAAICTINMKDLSDSVDSKELEPWIGDQSLTKKYFMKMFWFF